MKQFDNLRFVLYENARFDSHADRFFQGGVGFSLSGKTHGSRRPLSPMRSPWLPLPFSLAAGDIERGHAPLL
jgi:hypothetical protein